MSRWLKVDVSTPNKPAIVRLAADCNCSRGDAFLAFFRLFSWLDELTADGLVATDRAEVDAVARLPGCAASLEASGWLAFSAVGMLVTNWCEHNGASAKRRAINARNMTARREEARRHGLPVQSCPR